MIKHRKKTREEIQRMQDLRRCNASAPHRNKARYDRKVKYRGKVLSDA